jgi:hypothetical protein
VVLIERECPFCRQLTKIEIIPARQADGQANKNLDPLSTNLHRHAPLEVAQIW